MRNLSGPVSVISFIFLIITSGCEPEEYTLPVDFELEFRIAETPVMEGKLIVRSIALNLGSIEIEGRRAAGGDVSMTRKFDDSRFIIIRPHFTTEAINFNIPQGIYDRLAFRLKFRPDPEEEDLYDDFKEWLEDMEEGEEEIDDLREDLGDIIEDYQDVTPCLIMHAEYFKNKELHNVVFVINDPMSLNIIATNALGEREEVILDRNIINRGEIVFDPSNWFSVIEPPVLESAFYGVIDDHKYIFLHKKVNPLLFTTIYNRLDDSATLLIRVRL